MPRGPSEAIVTKFLRDHVGGDKLFVDYAGDTVPVIVDRLTGEVRSAQIFVAVMGASNFTYVSWGMSGRCSCLSQTG
jgi:transposase